MYNKISAINSRGTLITQYDKDNIENGSTLIVESNQQAVVFHNGHPLGLYGCGRHRLNTDVLPFLRIVIRSKTLYEVFFVNISEQHSFQWGTDRTIQLLDKRNDQSYQIGANGEIHFKVTNAMDLLKAFVDERSGLTWEIVYDRIKREAKLKLQTYMVEAIKGSCQNLSEIDEKLLMISDIVGNRLTNDFSQYGLVVSGFVISQIITSNIVENEPVRYLSNIDGQSTQPLIGNQSAEVTSQCRNCREKIGERGLFCRYCGNPFTRPGRFCPNCGKERID